MDENQISYEEIDKEIEERAAAKRRRLPHEIFEFSELVLIVLAIIILTTTFLFRQTVVSGGSMEPTLHDGERLVISNFLYTPTQGDIVVLQLTEELAESSPTLFENEAVIKRVIATEGQTVSIEDGVLYVDGVAQEEDYILDPTQDPHTGCLGGSRYLTMAPRTVSPGRIFVMGDHRCNSLDSRTFGEVDERTVIGKVLFRLFPLSEFGGVD